jgi:Holliday junction resolvase-like predicted endonuclease
MRYETKAHRASEARVRRVLADKWRCEVVASPDAAPYDALFRRGGEVSAMVEIRCRSVSWGHYRDLIISKKKVDQMHRLAHASQRPVKCLFVVAFTDAIVGLSLEPEAYAVTKGGRTDRGDPNDVELVYQIPTDWFNLIERQKEGVA